HHIGPAQTGNQPVAIEGEVLVTEISGSESVVHFRLADRAWVSQSHGIHAIEVGEHARLYADVGKAMLFGTDNRLVAG
ncbi:MAG TPA: ABC transporter ATP-binding protein, partial [Afifellaceae bacterium]|nr:ABC transporter ATP-binding protein [Afifellaceae bacterium]